MDELLSNFGTKMIRFWRWSGSWYMRCL